VKRGLLLTLGWSIQEIESDLAFPHEGITWSNIDARLFLPLLRSSMRCNYFSIKRLNIRDMKTFFSHIGYIGKMKKNFYILRFMLHF